MAANLTSVISGRLVSEHPQRSCIGWRVEYLLYVIDAVDKFYFSEKYPLFVHAWHFGNLLAIISSCNMQVPRN